MKEILFATIFAVCLCDVSGMDRINASTQSTITSSGYTLSTIRGMDNTVTISFSDADGYLFTKDIDTIDLIPGVSRKVDDEHLKGVEILRESDDNVAFRITEEFTLFDKMTDKLIMDFTDSDLFLTKIPHARFIKVNARNVIYDGKNNMIQCRSFILDTVDK